MKMFDCCGKFAKTGEQVEIITISMFEVGFLWRFYVWRTYCLLRFLHHRIKISVKLKQTAEMFLVMQSMYNLVGVSVRHFVWMYK